MLSVLAGLVLAVAVQDDPAQDLSKLCKELVKSDSYTFEIVAANQRGGMFGGRMRGGRGADRGADQNAGPEPQKVTGQYRSGQPCHLKTGDVEAYKVGDATVYRQGDGEWRLFDRSRMMQGMRSRMGGGGQGGQGRGQRPRGNRGAARQGGEQGNQARANRFGSMRAIMSMAGAQLPHEILAKLDGKLTDVKSAEEGGQLVYTATLTKEAAEAIGGMRRFGGRRGGGDRQGPSFDYSGTIKITLSKAGRIEKVVLDTTMSGSFGERSFERSSTRTVTIKNQGETDYKVPEEALSKFEV